MIDHPRTLLTSLGHRISRPTRRASAAIDTLTRRAPRVVLGTLAVAVIVSVTALGYFWNQHRLDDRTTNRANEALASLRHEVPRLLSYRADGIDADFTQKYALLTGKFKDDFENLSRSTIIPAAKESHLDTTAKVAESGVVGTPSPDTVVVLMFIDQSTTSTDDPDPKLDGSRVRVTAHLVDGSWKIAALQPI